MKLAIVGGGPSAFYVASRLLQLAPPTSPLVRRIDIYDRNWAPHGLVRYGVAPDHPEVKVRTLHYLIASLFVLSWRSLRGGTFRMTHRTLHSIAVMFKHYMLTYRPPELHAQI